MRGGGGGEPAGQHLLRHDKLDQLHQRRGRSSRYLSHHDCPKHSVGATGRDAGERGGMECLCWDRAGRPGVAKRIADRGGPDVAATGHGDDGRPGTGKGPVAQLPEAGAEGDPEGLMATTIGSAISAKVLQRITGPAGVNSGPAALTQGSAAAPAPDRKST